MSLIPLVPKQFSLLCLSEHRQSVVLFKSGCVLGFGKFEGELKQENWLVPHSIGAGAAVVTKNCNVS
jgi:hypothetical protein